MPKQPQLQMCWPEDQLDSPPEIKLAQGYRLRQYRPEDKAAYLRLMHSAGFADFSEERIEQMEKKLLEDGFFIIEHEASGGIVATAMATHNPTPQYPRGAELGWVAADPGHRGKGLGEAASVAATRRMIAAGYRRIYLLTDDERLAALKVYLRMGYEPVMGDADMTERWNAIRQALKK